MKAVFRKSAVALVGLVLLSSCGQSGQAYDLGAGVQVKVQAPVTFEEFNSSPERTVYNGSGDSSSYELHRRSSELTIEELIARVDSQTYEHHPERRPTVDRVKVSGLDCAMFTSLISDKFQQSLECFESGQSVGLVATGDDTPDVRAEIDAVFDSLQIDVESG